MKKNSNSIKIQILNVCLILFIITGCNKTDSSSTKIPISDFYALQTTISKGESVKFYDQSKNEPEYWFWDFGDGSTSNEQNPIHIYVAAGKYTVSLVVTNSAGLGNEIKTDYIIVENKFETSTVTDIDGNTYQTVKIGDQWWMAENLATTKYNDGNNIPNLTISADWLKLNNPSYCWYENNQSTYKSTYGALYNKYTVETDKLCPSGWHIPSEPEWKSFFRNLGPEYLVGSKLKETGIEHWLNPNDGATNETGFTALPGGKRGGLGDFSNLGAEGYWWTSTSPDNETGFCIIMNYSRAGVGWGTFEKRTGLSVRCLKN